MAALENVLNTFREIHPDVTIKQQAFADMAEMLAQYEVAADAGLGPDLLITAGQQVRPFATAHLIDPITAEVDDTVLPRYDAAALDSLRYGDEIYGLPVAMDTLVLYYDKNLVEQPAVTLDALLAEAAQGRLVAISTNFVDAYWGVNAFGGSLFDSERRVILDRGGFANWLAWLKEARDVPGMLLDSNREILRNRFIDDGIAYYVGYASEYRLLTEGTEEMPGKGEDGIGVAMLPSGPTGGSAPFLKVQALLFASASSENQREIALEFAKFVTNTEQQSTLMRDIRLVPANDRVRVNPRLEPIVATFTGQARAAVPILNIFEMDAVFQYGGDAYTRVLEGVIEPAEAAVSVTAAINQANGLEALASLNQQCNYVGTVYLGYLVDAHHEQALATALEQLQRRCPSVIVNTVAIDLPTPESEGTPSEIAAETSPTSIANAAMSNTIDAMPLRAEDADALAARLATSLPSQGRLDLVLLPHRWIPALASRSQLRDLSTVLSAETLQRYRPASVDAMRYDGKLYGLPMTIGLNAFYYNRTLVEQPAQTLDELLQQMSAGTPFVMDYTFRHAFWGIPAFGGQLIAEQGALGLGTGGFTEWLQWLLTAREQPTLVLTPDRTVALEAFLNGTSAYYVGGSELLPHLREVLGAENVGVARLPSGPSGDAGPLLAATGLLLTDRLSESQTQLVLSVADYLTSVDSQILFFDLANEIPTNVGLAISSEEPLAAFVEQARTAVLLANTPTIDLAIQTGDALYSAVFEESADPVEAVDAWLATIRETIETEASENVE